MIIMTAKRKGLEFLPYWMAPLHKTTVDEDVETLDRPSKNAAIQGIMLE